MRIAHSFLLAVAIICTAPLPAQTGKQPTPAQVITYKLTFTVKDLAAGKATGSRSYSALFVDGVSYGGSSIRAEDDIPLLHGRQDFDINFDFRSLAPSPALSSHQLALNVTAALSLPIEAGDISGSAAPAIRHYRWSSNFVVDLGKPTLLFSSDDPTLDRTTQVELTAVRVP